MRTSVFFSLIFVCRSLMLMRQSRNKVMEKLFLLLLLLGSLFSQNHSLKLKLVKNIFNKATNYSVVKSSSLQWVRSTHMCFSNLLDCRHNRTCFLSIFRYWRELNSRIRRYIHAENKEFERAKRRKKHRSASTLVNFSFSFVVRSYSRAYVYRENSFFVYIN